MNREPFNPLRWYPRCPYCGVRFPDSTDRDYHEDLCSWNPMNRDVPLHLSVDQFTGKPD